MAAGKRRHTLQQLSLAAPRRWAAVVLGLLLCACNSALCTFLSTQDWMSINQGIQDAMKAVPTPSPRTNLAAGEAGGGSNVPFPYESYLDAYSDEEDPENEDTNIDSGVEGLDLADVDPQALTAALLASAGLAAAAAPAASAASTPAADAGAATANAGGAGSTTGGGSAVNLAAGTSAEVPQVLQQQGPQQVALPAAIAPGTIEVPLPVPGAVAAVAGAASPPPGSIEVPLPTAVVGGGGVGEGAGPGALLQQQALQQQVAVLPQEALPVTVAGASDLSGTGAAAIGSALLGDALMQASVNPQIAQIPAAGGGGGFGGSGSGLGLGGLAQGWVQRLRAASQGANAVANAVMLPNGALQADPALAAALQQQQLQQQQQQLQQQLPVQG